MNLKLQSMLSLLIAMLFAAAPAAAVERYQAVTLPDAGFGSSVDSFSVPTGADRMELIPIGGSMTLGDGSRVPVLWMASPLHGQAMVTELPIPVGAEGRATGATLDQLALPLLCGTVTTDDSVDNATVWISGDGGLMEALPLPDRGNGSRANGLLPGVGTTRGDVVGNMTLPSGRTVPVVWTVDLATEEIVFERLPLPAGSEGTANSITQAAAGELTAGGTLNRNGRTRAARWTNDGSGWTGERLETPQGTDSMIIKTGGTEFRETTVVASVGAICDELGCTATLWGPGGNALLLPAVQKFNESTANCLFDGSGALAVVGEAVGNEAGSVGAIFLPGADLAADVNNLLVNPDAITVTQVTAIEGGIMFGNGLKDGPPPVNCGVIFIPVLGVAAQRMNVSVGRVLQGDVISTWQEDGDRLRLRPERLRGQPTIVAGLEAQQIGDTAYPEAFVHLHCNGRSQDASSKFAVRVQLFNFQTSQWDTAGQFEATTTEACYSVEAPAVPASYIDNKNRVRTRLQVRRTAGSGRWEFEINSLSSMVEGESCGI